MKKFTVMIGAALTSLLLGCSSTPVAVAPIGPNPVIPGKRAGNGQLEVFSALRGHSEGNNPCWYQHTAYYIRDHQGRPVKRVDNRVGRYAQAPRVINLPPGEYLVKAQAKDYLWVDVPVVIEPGKLTEVHLDDAWRPADARNTELVSLPAGNPVGWWTDEK